MTLYLISATLIIALPTLILSIRLLSTSNSASKCDPTSPARFLTLNDGRRVCFTEFGPGDDDKVKRIVIHFHSLPGSRVSLPVDTERRALHSWTRVICVDRPGIGLSDRLPTTSTSLGSYSDDLKQILDILIPGDGKEREIWITGHSAGCPHALLAASLLAHRCSHVLLFGPVATPSALNLPETAFNYEDGLRESSRGMTRMVKGRPGLMRWIMWLLAPFFCVPKTAVEDIVKTEPGVKEMKGELTGLEKTAAECFRQGVQGMTGDLVRCGHGPWRIDFEGIKCGVEIVVGTQDRFCPVAMSRGLAGFLGKDHRVKLEEVANEGHFTLFYRHYLDRVIV